MKALLCGFYVRDEVRQPGGQCLGRKKRENLPGRGSESPTVAHGYRYNCIQLDLP